MLYCEPLVVWVVCFVLVREASLGRIHKEWCIAVKERIWRTVCFWSEAGKLINVTLSFTRFLHVSIPLFFGLFRIYRFIYSLHFAVDSWRKERPLVRKIQKNIFNGNGQLGIVTTIGTKGSNWAKITLDVECMRTKNILMV